MFLKLVQQNDGPLSCLVENEGFVFPSGGSCSLRFPCGLFPKWILSHIQHVAVFCFFHHPPLPTREGMLSSCAGLLVSLRSVWAGFSGSRCRGLAAWSRCTSATVRGAGTVGFHSRTAVCGAKRDNMSCLCLSHTQFMAASL